MATTYAWTELEKLAQSLNYRGIPVEFIEEMHRRAAEDDVPVMTVVMRMGNAARLNGAQCAKEYHDLMDGMRRLLAPRR